MIENTFPFVKELSEEDRAMLVGSMVTKNFPKGSIVNRNEDGCVGVLSVTAGRLRVYIVSDEGREITLFRVDPGEICVLSVSCLLDSINTVQTIITCTGLDDFVSHQFKINKVFHVNSGKIDNI